MNIFNKNVYDKKTTTPLRPTSIVCFWQC
jgi:hypothetical protein